MIKTERLILRNWKIEDAESMYKYAKNPEIGPMAGWPAHESIETSKMIINTFINHLYCFAICLKDDLDHPIGCCELKTESDMTNRSDEYELGYWLGQEFWGKGIMPEACKALIDYGFNELKLNAIWCGYYDGNNKSKRVQEKLGFKYHHTTQGIKLSLLNEVRTGHVSLMTKETWIKINNTKKYNENKIKYIPKADVEMMREDIYESSGNKRHKKFNY